MENQPWVGDTIEKLWQDSLLKKEFYGQILQMVVHERNHFFQKYLRFCQDTHP